MQIEPSYLLYYKLWIDYFMELLDQSQAYKITQQFALFFLD